MWSDELKQMTKDAVHEYRFVPRNNVVYFKNYDGRFGVIAVSDILANRLLLSDGKNNVENLYCSVDELLDDGWVVD